MTLLTDSTGPASANYEIDGEKYSFDQLSPDAVRTTETRYQYRYWWNRRQQKYAFQTSHYLEKNRIHQEKYNTEMDYYASGFVCKDKKTHQYRKRC